MIRRPPRSTLFPYTTLSDHTATTEIYTLSLHDALRSRWSPYLWIRAELAQDRQHDALALLEQRGEQMLGRRLGVAAIGRKRVGGLQRLLGLDREAVEMHTFLNLSRGD